MGSVISYECQCQEKCEEYCRRLVKVKRDIKKGKALIVNNKTFQDSETFEERIGSDKDVEKLKEVLTKKLNCDFTPLINYDKRELLQGINTFKDNCCETLPDYVIIIIMTHGAENGAIVAADGEYYFTHDAWNIFKDTLPEVPKIFIFQACRGQLNEIDKKENLSTFDRHPINFTNYIRNSDTVLLFSTLEGARSNRLKSGTCFITELVNAINTLFKPNKLVSLYELMYYVSSNISKSPIKDEKSGELSIQTPCTQSFLDKQIILGDATDLMNSLPSAESDMPKYRLDNPFAYILLYPKDVHVDISNCYRNVFARFWCSSNEVEISDEMPVGNIEYVLHGSFKDLQCKSALVLTLIGKTEFKSNSNENSYIEFGKQRLTFANLWNILSIKKCENFSNKPKIVLVLDPFEIAKSDNVSADNVYHDVTKTSKPIINIQHKDILMYFLNDKHSMKCLENEILCASEEDICTVILKSMKNSNINHVYPCIISTLTAKFELKYQTTSLFDAIINKDTFLVKKLLMEVGTLENNDSYEDNMPILETAISLNAWDIVDMLLLRNANVNKCNLKQAYKTVTDNFGNINQKIKSHKLGEYVRNERLGYALTLIFHADRYKIKERSYDNFLKYLADKSLHHFFKYAFEQMIDKNPQLMNSLLRLSIEKSGLRIIQTLVENGADVNSTMTIDCKTDSDNAAGLHIAVHNKNRDIIEYLLKNNANINAKLKNGNTPLHLAVEDNDTDIATVLLHYNADPNIKNGQKKSPFVIAIEYKAMAMIKILFTETKHFNPDFKIFKTIFEHGTLDILKYVLANERIDVNMSTTFYKFNIKFPLQSRTPLLYAIKTKAPNEYIEYLLHCGAKTSAIDEDGNNALLTAVISHLPSDKVENLVKINKTIINDKNFEGETVLYNALLFYDLIFISRLIDVYKADINIRPRNGRSVIHQAVKRNDKYILQYLLQKAPKVDISDPDGNSPLHEAIQQSCCIDIVKFLVQYNRNLIVMRNIKNETPLNLASNMLSTNTNDNQEVVEIFKFLVNVESNLKEKVDNSTVVEQVVSTEHLTVDLIQTLIKEETALDPVTSTKILHSLFPFCQWNNIEEKLKYLIEKKADVNAKDQKGMSVLHKAVSAHSIEATSYLITHCAANVNAVDAKLNTPLHTAVLLSKPEYYAQNIKIISILVENGADLNSKGQNNLTPLQIAWGKRMYDVVEYLIDNGAKVESKTVEDVILDYQKTKSLNNLKKVVDAINDKTIKEHALAFAFERSLTGLINYFVEELGTDLKVEMCHSLFRNGEICEDMKVLDLLKRTRKINDKLMTGNTVLHEAVEVRNIGLVKHLVENGANINVTNFKQKSCLHLAIMTSSPKIVEYLINNEAIINLPDGDGYTPLHAAASVRNVEIFEILIKYNAKIDAKTNDGYSILHTLMLDYFTPTFYADKPEEDLRLTLRHKSNLSQRQSKSVKQTGVLEIMHILRKRKINFNDTCKDGTSVLQMAVEKTKSIAIIKELIDVHGANYNACSNNGKTIFMSAIESRSDAIITYLVNKSVKMPDDCLISVIKWGKIQTIKCLVEAGADINSRDKTNETPLHLTTRREDPGQFIRYLLQNKADINAVDCDGSNILHKALKFRHHINIIDSLLNESKLEINARDKEGNNALHIVLQQGRKDMFEIVKRLVNKGVDINGKNYLGETVMSLAEDMLCQKRLKFLKNHVLLKK